MTEPPMAVHSPKDPREPETVPGKVLLPPVDAPSVNDVSSIDSLLAMTSDDTWDLDAQVRSLQAAAVDGPRHAGPLRAKAPNVTAPTPIEISPSYVSGPQSLGPSADRSATERGSQPGAGPSKPPPLPPPLPTRASKGPPPLPGQMAGQTSSPPPLPRAGSLPSIPEATGSQPRRLGMPDQTGAQGRRGATPSAPASDPGGLGTHVLVELLAARIGVLEASNDKVGLARAHIEMAIAVESLLGDDARAIAHAEAALKVDSRLAAAHALLRRKRHGLGAIAQMLGHLEHEIAASTDESSTVELLVEKARLLEAGGEKADFVRQVWEQALTRAPHHPAALKGLEIELATRAYAVRHAELGAPQKAAAAAAVATGVVAESFDALAAHLGRMAEAYASEPKLAAWLHVERANLLESRLRKIEEARGALERAVELDPSVGPVRSACVRHVSAHNDAGALAALLEEEARIEVDTHRAARLELDAACIASERLSDRPRAIELLTRAARRAPTARGVDRRVLDDLVRLHEAEAQWVEAGRARRARLAYITDPQVLAYELRMLARIGERTDELDSAIADVERALAVDPNDATLLDMMDRLLASVQKDEQRVKLWLDEAGRLTDGTRRARALGRAAQIAETALLRPNEAILHLRAAWVASPGDSEVLDALARLLAPAPSEVLDREARALLDLYAQAVDATHDVGRKVAYLEKTAVLWEEVIGDARRATRAYEEILKYEPNRRGAVLGLARSAARVGDDRALARALLDEARLADDGVDVLTLRVRAATALARVDPARALSLVDEVLELDTAHPSARTLETRLHEEAGRWERAAQSLRARIDHTSQPKEKITLWLALAQIQDLRLRSPKDALASLQAARMLDPQHPVPPEEITRMLEAAGDHQLLRSAIEELGANAVTTEERVRHLVRAAEIDELRIGDDTRAALTYARAMAEAPDEELTSERLERVLARRAAATRNVGELVALQTKRIEAVRSPVEQRNLQFDLAQLLVEVGTDLPHAASLLDSVLVEDEEHIPSLRLLETIQRRLGDWAPLAQTLSRQGGSLLDVRAKLGALWSLATLEEWRLPASEAGATYARILQLDPTDPAALEATIRRDLANARRGEPKARKAVVGALRALFAVASDDGTRLAIQLRLALLLEESAAEAGEATAASTLREALDRYRASLHLDELSVTAATGLARTATRLRDTEGAIYAATSLAELARSPRARARYLLDAAELLLGAPRAERDERLGPVVERRAKVCVLLEKALDSDPDSLATAARLAAVRAENDDSERVVAPFRTALGAAKSPETIIMLGGEIARVARDVLADLPLGIEAMRRVREVAPTHVPSLLTLAELCIAQRAWPEAVDALESVVAKGRDTAPRLTALFSLASMFEHVLDRPEDVERALRTALGIDPNNPRAIRALLRHITTGRGDIPIADDGGRGDLPAKDRLEIAELLERLSNVERDPDQRTDILLELAETRAKLGDPAAVERALIEAVAQSPDSAKAFGRLAGCFRTSTGHDFAAYARALLQVVARGQQHGQVDARWYATLGQIEIDSLQRIRDGIGHLQQAVQLKPDLYETRFELARAFAKLAAHEDTSRQLLAMISPVSTPLLSIKEPAAALALLEQSLGGERRAEEALVISELRAVAGDLDEGRHTWLRQRRLPPLEGHNAQLDRPALVTHVLPSEGRHVLLEVAAAMAGLESKILRADLTEIGITARDRVSARSGHPTRVLLDRIARTLGLVDIELVITPTVTRTRVLAQDTLWVVVPRALCDLPEPVQLASLGRALTRISLGVPWLEELPPPHIEALLIACARQSVHGYGADELDVLSSKLVAQYEPTVARAISRKQKKLLDELAPHIGAPQGRPIPIDVFIGALARAELRAAALLTGDLLATFDDLRGLDAALFHATERPSMTALSALLEHPFAGDVCRYALSGEALALRRRIGTTWTG